jgi:two-component system LytT family response regulator
MNVILIDDEKVMHLILSKMLSKIPDLNIVGSFQDTASASLFIENHDIHLAFVDISMPHESGMQFAKRMTEKKRNLHIVFVTSHKEYAMDAFDLFALDYIVKPVSQIRLEKTVKRAMAIHHSTDNFMGNKDTNQVFIYSMGGLDVRHGNKGNVKWRSRKSAELFGYLLLHRGRMVSRSRITDDIFEGMPQRNAETYLNTIIYQLRKSLEPHGLKSLVISDKDGYSLDISDAYIDFIDFEERIKKFSVIEASNLDQAIETEELYSGNLFGEKAFLWALNDVERLMRMYTVFVIRMSEFMLKNNEENSTTIRLLNKLRGYNELDEETVGLLLRAYAAQMDKASLVNLFEGYSKLLRKELGIRPSQELVILYADLHSKLEIM